MKERGRQWAVRLGHEAQLHEECCFITLTYDDDHLPADGSLVVQDCQNFLKRFRERISPVRIKFFLAGEYGDEKERPHYHAIIFGWRPSGADRIPLSGKLVESQLVSEAWGNGFVSVGEVEPASVAYVAQYALKKVGKLPEWYSGRKPEFVLMSRGGRDGRGIGHGWIEKFHGDVYPSDEVMVGGSPRRPPRYYDKWLEARDLELFNRIKERRCKESEVLEEETQKSRPALTALGSRAKRLRAEEALVRSRDGLKKRKL